MRFPDLIYDDFYKFCMSLGIVLVLIGTYFTYNAISVISNIPEPSKILYLLQLPGWVIFTSGFLLIILSGRKWYDNQKLLDEKLKNEVALIKIQTAETIQKSSFKGGFTSETKTEEIKKPRIEYGIGSVFPGTVKFNFKNDWRVWFLVRNLDDRNYKVYFTAHFYINDKYVDTIKKDHYSGNKAWNINSNTLIRAPGLCIPQKVRDKYNWKKDKFEIRIDCEVKDENDNLLDKRLPVGYVYEPNSDSWYFEP